MAGAGRAYGEKQHQVAARDLLEPVKPSPGPLLPSVSTAGTQPAEERAGLSSIWVPWLWLELERYGLV